MKQLIKRCQSQIDYSRNPSECGRPAEFRIEGMNLCKFHFDTATQKSSCTHDISHPSKVIGLLKVLKDRGGKETILKPNHWSVQYSLEYGLLTLHDELSGPLGIKTGEKIAYLTEKGKESILT